ncbi:MAG TPA: DNA topoisomerase IB [Planctomycetota bacterium]|nr:DNA topoisomerase IB [Planctomycetota bacterium]
MPSPTAVDEFEGRMTRSERVRAGRARTGRAKTRPRASAVAELAVDDARSAGLRYVSDLATGIRRVRAGRGFRYVDAEGKPVRNRAELERIRALAIPPAWDDVRVCDSPRGHLQAVGRDARGRRQYRYHQRWREVRNENKYGQLIDFARALPALRRRVRRDLSLPGLPRRKVLATVVWLLENTMVRVGNEEYARENESFGLTTLRDRHANFSGGTLELQFRGKSGKLHRVRVGDRRVVRIVRACQDIPGYELFQYLDERGNGQRIGSEDVNEYLRDATGAEFTAKSFRTWTGTVQALAALRSLPTRASAPRAAARVRRRDLAQVIRKVAAVLGNTPAVCRACYIHPAVISAFEAGTLRATLAALARRSRGTRGRSDAESLTLAFLLASSKARHAA